MAYLFKELFIILRKISFSFPRKGGGEKGGWKERGGEETERDDRDRKTGIEMDPGT